MSDEQRQSDAQVPATVDTPAAAASVAVPVLAPAPPGRGVVTVPPGRSAALVRAQAAASQLVPQVQYQITRLGPAGQVGLAALVAALVVAAGTLMPARHALQALSADLVRAQHPSAAALADQAAPRLVASLPTRAQIPAVIGQIFIQAKEAGVSLDTGHYVFSPAKAGAIARYDLEFPVKASYPDIRGFINRTLSVVPAAALAKLHVERKAVGDPVVNANIGFVVFVRSEPRP